MEDGLRRALQRTGHGDLLAAAEHGRNLRVILQIVAARIGVAGVVRGDATGRVSAGNQVDA